MLFIVSLLFSLQIVSAQVPEPVSSSSYSTFGKSVSLVLAFNITGRNSDNLSGSNDYVAAASPNAVLGITSSKTFGTRFDRNYSSDNYAIEMKTPLEDSRFFMVFTPGNSTVISNKIENLKINGILSKTFGDFHLVQPDALDIFLRVAYSDINILGRLQLGPGSRKIDIKNEGVDNKGITNITLGLIK